MTTELIKHRPHSSRVTALVLTVFVLALATFSQLKGNTEVAEAIRTESAPLVCLTSDAAGPETETPTTRLTSRATILLR